MKKLLVLVILMGSLLSCSIGDDSPRSFYYETLPIESVTIPEEFQFGSTHEISMTYFRPTGCHVFYDFYYVSEQNQRTVAIINTVFSDQQCETFDNEEVEVSFNFQVNSTEPYVFRFWQGEDDNGTDTYYIVEVPVVE